MVGQGFSNMYFTFWSLTHFSIPDDLKDKCGKQVCKCDREAAKCFRKSPYNSKYAVWPDFLCGDKHPTCNIY